MYIWVLLATFMVAIYSFNLSHRADMKDLVVEPQIEPSISRMMVMHGAAEKFLDDNGPNVDKPTDPIKYFPGDIPFSKEVTISGSKVDVGLKGYLPFGFTDDIANGKTKTMIYCLNKQGTAEGPLCNNTTNSCCNRPDTVPYLVTFSCVPKRWQNTGNGNPSPYFIKVFNKIATIAYNMGYVEVLSNTDKNSPENFYKSDIGLRTGLGSFVSVPKFIVNNILPSAEISFSEVCGSLKTSDGVILTENGCSSCLAYVSVKKDINSI